MDTASAILRVIAFSALAGFAVMLAVLGPLYALGFADVFGQALSAVLGIFAAVIALVCLYPKGRSDLM